LTLESVLSLVSDMLHSINTRLVVLHDGVDELLGELPNIQETAQGVNALLNELKLLKLVTGNLRTELYSVLEKLTEVASLDEGTGQSSMSVSEQTATQIVGIQGTLPVLRQALERLTVSSSFRFIKSTRIEADVILLRLKTAQIWIPRCKRKTRKAMFQEKCVIKVSSSATIT
jgi:hypothetical protein